MLEKPKNRWQRLTYVHPNPHERGQTLNETDRLFRMGLWDAFGFGIAIGIATPNVLALMNSFLDLQLQIASSDLNDWQALGAALILAPLIAVAAGLSTWRTTFAALVQVRVPQGIGRAGLCIGVGLILGTFLSLSFDSSSSVNPLFLFVLNLPWSIVVLVSLFLFLRWIAMGTAAWLDVMVASRSPRLFYIVGMVIASAVFVVVLAQLFLFHLLATIIAPLLSTPSDLLIGFAGVIIGSLALLILDTLLSPGVLVAFICLWAFPLATWFWRKQVTTPVVSNWAFLGIPSQPVVLPRQDPFRLRFALTVGLVGGLVFCGLLLMIRIVVHLSVPETIRGTHQFLILFFYSIIVLAALLQATAAGIVASRVRRLGALHGLFASFIGGCVMTIGFTGINLPFGGSATADVIWFTFRYMINGGALLALPITLIVSVIVNQTRKPYRDVHEGRRQTMFCEHCGADNPETAIHCRMCGKRMEGKREKQAPQQVFQGTILFLAGPLAGRSFPITPPVTTIGHDQRNTIVIPDPAVSPFHARIFLTGSGWVIELLTPQNILMVNQIQTRQQLLRDQDVIRLGPVTVFRCGLNMGRPQSPRQPVPPVQPPAPGQTRQPQPFPPAPRPQQIRYAPLLSRRTVLIGGAALAGGVLLVAGGVKIVSSLFSSFSPSEHFQHVALGIDVRTYRGHNDSVLTVAWSPDSIHIASGADTRDPTARVWNAFDGTEVYTYKYYVPVLDSVVSVAWSPDGARVLTSNNNKDIHAWNATDGGQDTTFQVPSTLSIDTVWQVAWSPDGTRIAAACSGINLNNYHVGTVLVWDVASAKALTYYTAQFAVYSVAWSPDNQRIAAAIDTAVQVLEVSSWKTSFSYQGHTDLVKSVAWSPDSTHIASGSGSITGNDYTVQVWNATNGKPVSTYSRHTKAVKTVAWSPDSKRLASGSDDWTVQVWNAADARHFYIYRGHADSVNQVAWSPDSTRIASASSDKTVQVWGAG